MKVGLVNIDRVKNSLLVNTSEVDRFILLNSLECEDSARFAKMLRVLTHPFNAIVDIHRKVLDSRVGVQEILLIAEEPDLTQRSTNNHNTLYNLFVMNDGYGLLIGLGLEGITLVILKQIKLRDHHMPLEYAITTVVPVQITTIEFDMEAIRTVVRNAAGRQHHSNPFIRLAGLIDLEDDVEMEDDGDSMIGSAANW